MHKLSWVILLSMPLALGAAEPSKTAPSAPTHAKPKKAPAKVAHKAKKVAPAAAAAAAAVAVPAAAALSLPADDPRQATVEQVHTGRMQCELGVHVNVQADPNTAGGFILHMRSQTYHMTPVVSSTGAVRLEDPKVGAMWLQLANKSMLMNTKLGQRLADECQSPAQLAVAEQMKHNPPPSLLDDPGVARK